MAQQAWPYALRGSLWHYSPRVLTCTCVSSWVKRLWCRSPCLALPHRLDTSGETTFLSVSSHKLLFAETVAKQNKLKEKFEKELGNICNQSRWAWLFWLLFTKCLCSPLPLGDRENLKANYRESPIYGGSTYSFFDSWMVQNWNAWSRNSTFDFEFWPFRG